MKKKRKKEDGMRKSIKKHIRKEKARIRREFLDEDERNKKIKELINKFKKNKKTT